MKQLEKLADVKSLVTLSLTGAFIYLGITGQVTTEFLGIYTSVIAFYFGTQHQKVTDSQQGGKDDDVER